MDLTWNYVLEQMWVVQCTLEYNLPFVYHYGTNTSNQIICFEMFVVNGVGVILRSIRFLTQLR